jgi:hypothetical protein
MLSSSDGVASVPGTLTIPAGATSGEFTITTTIVATEMPVTISASLGSETKSAVITGAADGRSQTRDDSPVLQDHEELLNRLKPSLCAASRNPDVIKFVCRLS